MNDRTLARFWSKVAKGEGSGCWLWTAGSRQGYGQFGVAAGRVVDAHRISWELANGPIPAGLFVCHTCDVRICVRPDHLFLGTHSDNMQDMHRKGRANTRAVCGEEHYAARLTEADVRAIRTATGQTLSALARAFGVSRTHIRDIRIGKKWAYLAAEARR
jgi:hypothetical protein